MQQLKWLTIGLLLALLVPLAGAQEATGGPYTLDGTVSNGGGSSSGGVYSVVGSAGEFDSTDSPLTGGTYRLVGGGIRIPAPSLLGDCNADGLLDAGDLAALNNVLAGGVAPSTACDANFDGRANANDQACLRLRIFDTTFVCTP